MTERNEYYFIAIEGVEGSGRTLHVDSLKQWLEEMGYGVEVIGVQRSRLMGENLQKVKKTIAFQSTTQFLAFVTDLADQVENVAVPAMKAGFIVLADGYSKTIASWALSRGLREDWIKDVLSVLPEPSLTISLISAPRVIIKRLIKKKGYIDPAEVGIGSCYGTDLYTVYWRYVRDFQENLVKLSQNPVTEVLRTDRKMDDVVNMVRQSVKRVIGYTS